MTTEKKDLARQVDAAQSILHLPAADEGRRLERALADWLRAFSGANHLDVAGGVAIWAGVGSPLTQGMAMGLGGAVAADELERFEAFFRRDGQASCQMEVCPFADPSLFALLAARGFRVNEWQLVWSRPVRDELFAPPPPEITIRRVEPGEEETYLRVTLAGFLESEDVPDDVVDLLLPTTKAERVETYFAEKDGEAIGGATLSWQDGVAFVNGSGVRPAYRRLGAQGALIRTRLRRALELGCDIATSSTLPGTASRRNMERHGFHVAFPKIVMLRDFA